MQRKNSKIPSPARVLWLCSVLASSFPAVLVAQAPAATPAAVPAAPLSLASMNRLATEAEAAFASKDYASAVTKIQELLAALGTSTDGPIEQLNFNIGLAHLLAGKGPEAEEAFLECLKKFPKGEYASRCALGIGRARILQDTPEKKEAAVEPLRTAAKDPKYRSEAGLTLGKVYIDLKKRDEAMAIFRSLVGTDIRTPQQTMAAVEVLGLLSDAGDLSDLLNYLERLSQQAGIRDVMAWYANQVVSLGDELTSLSQNSGYETALALYSSVPPRSQILEIQTNSLNSQRKQLQALEAKFNIEKDKPLKQRSNASELISTLKPAIELSAVAMAAIQEKEDLDASLLMRRGRSFYHLNRITEAELCFRTIREKHSTSKEAQSAAYAEIVIQSKLKNAVEIEALCKDYLEKYPTADNAEQVATLNGEVLVQKGEWEKLGNYYRDLETKFPTSAFKDTYVFMQGVALFQSGKIKESTPIFTDFVKKFPQSPKLENARYYIALTNFLSNNYQETLKACKEYIALYPNGQFVGDLRYRLAFIDSNDKKVDQSDKIIRDLTKFLKDHPDDNSAGPMLCLIADTYKKKKSDKADELAKYLAFSAEAYRQAVWTSSSSEEITQYALDSLTTILQGNKDWQGIAALHTDFLKRRPDSGLALISASWVAKMKSRENKGAEATAILADAVKSKIGNPENEQVEFLLDELVKTLIPRKKLSETDLDALDKQLVETLNLAIGDQKNPTSDARLYYARAQLARVMKRSDIADNYLKGIATTNAQDPKALSPALLAISGDILLKLGKLDESEAIYKRLVERYKDGMFSDVGPVGLGYVALAKKQNQEALSIFETALTTNPGMSRFKEANLGKLQALSELGKLDDALKFALEIVGDKSFRGETAGKIYLIIGQIYRKQAARPSAGDVKTELLSKALATYQRVISGFKSVPDVCAEAHWQAYETCMEQGDKASADKYIVLLAAEPKLKNTARAKKAVELSK